MGGAAFAGALSFLLHLRARSRTPRRRAEKLSAKMSALRHWVASKPGRRLFGGERGAY